MHVGMVVRVVVMVVRMVVVAVCVGVRRARRRAVRAGHVQVSAKAEVKMQPPNIDLQQ
jgi:hypothetical protein